MHRIIEDGLEDFLAGRARRDFELHLSECQECSTEIEEFSSVSVLFREAFVVPDSELAPRPGFYLRVAENVAETIDARKGSSLWSFFSIDAVFGRRIAFGSLLALAVMGSFLISRETDAATDMEPGPEAIIAQHDPGSHDVILDRDRMMVTLASYER